MAINRFKTSFLPLFLCIFLLAGNNQNVFSADKHASKAADPSVVSFFKYRDNRESFQNIRTQLSRHVTETKELLLSLEQEGTSSNRSAPRRTGAESQLESKLVELTTVKQEVAELPSKGLGKAIGKRIDKLTAGIRAIRSASNLEQKTGEIIKLKEELTRYETIRLRNEIKVRSSLDPNGLNYKSIQPPANQESTEPQQKTDNNLSNVSPGTQSSHKTDSSSLVAKLTNSLESVIDFLVPSVMAEEYIQPAVNPSALSCYNDQADYDANIALDLSLAEADLEIDQSIDPVAYAKITSLAAELEYSPVKILEYITSEIGYEHYLGSVKGAVGTLTSGGGNDIDHASLLVALFRASGIPARYVRGQIYLQDKEAHLDWWNVKDLEALKKAVGAATQTYVGPEYTVDGITAVSTDHTWVEACVPYGNYRGTGDSPESHRWIPMDASYKSYERQDGIAQNEIFDYDSFLSARTRTLPHEEYESQVLEYIRNIDPNLTLADVGTTWSQQPVTYSFLPDTLPYAIRSYTDWNSTIASPKSASLPNEWRANVNIKFGSDSEFSIPLTDFAQHRISLSFEGATTADATSYLEFMEGDRTLDCDSNNLTVTPIFKKDGVEIESVDLSPLTICEGDDFRNISMQVNVKANNKIVTATQPGSNYLEFDTISPLDYYALSAYPFNGSETYLAERNSMLLENLNSIDSPSANPDDTTGEFLNIVLTKYMDYVTEASLEIGRLMGTTGRSGHHIGVASTRADVEYVFDLPFAIHSNNFVVDVPGGLSQAVNIEGGDINFDGLRLSGYVSSHYESYVWQEMALKDAVSTVSGLQIASSENNEVRSFTSATELEAFVNTCSDWPDGSTWPRSKSLASIVAEYRAAGVYDSDWLKNSILLPNINYFTSYSTEAQIDNALAADFDHCYPQGFTTNVSNNSFPSGYTNKVTISRMPVSYRGWLGPVYATESIRDDNLEGSFGFPISSFSGGYTVPTSDPVIYSGSSSSGSSSSSSYSTGFDVQSGVSSTTTNYSTSATTTVNSGVGDGETSYTTSSHDPVNMVTGNMYHEETDISLPARGLPLLFKRTYNSRSPEDGPLGWGWAHSFNQTLAFIDTNENNTPDTIVWTNGTGSKKYIGLDEGTPVVGGVRNITSNQIIIPDGFYFSLERPYSSGAAGEIEIMEKSGISYHFQGVNGLVDDIARLTRITDRNGNEINLAYDGSKLTSVTDADNRTLSFDYYGGTELIHTITYDWDGTVHEYFYDADNNLTGYRNPRDRNRNIDSSSYSYYSEDDGHNLEHRLETFSYANGYTMTFEYYVNGKAYRHTNAEGETVTFSYNDFRREATTVDELGRVQHFIFNKNGLPIEITDPLGGKEIYLYEDPNDPMLRTSVINAMGYVTEYSYDTDGNLTSTTLPSGDNLAYSYFNDFGQPQLIKNSLGNYSIRKYDGAGNLTDTVLLKNGFGASVHPETFDPIASANQIVSWTRIEYDQYGKLTKLRKVKDFTDGNSGPWTKFDYTDLNNSTEGIVPTSASYYGNIDGDGLIGELEGLGTYESSYDSQGRLVSGYNGALYPVDYSYDEAGLLQEGTGSFGGIQTFSYDASGLFTGQGLMWNNNGQITLADNSSASFDKANRRIVSSDSSGASSYYEYDDSGNLKKATSPDGYTISFDYDDLNRVVSAYDEEGNTVERELDLIGRVKKLIDPNGNVTLYTYYGPESNGRLKRVTDAEGRWTEFTYDSGGKVTRVINSAGRETLSDYDELGRVIRVVSPVYTDSVLGNVRPLTTYSYNTLGQQSKVYGGYTNSAGELSADSLELQASYEYDDFGRLLKKYDAANYLWEISEYDVHSNVLTSSDPNGNSSSFSYGYGGVLESKTIRDSSGTVQETIQYTRNGIGQPTRIESANVIYDYLYDTAHRLTNVTDSRGGKSVAYDYSVGGLLNSINDNHGNKTSYMYDPVGRLTGIRTPDQGLISYIYDSGGRLRQKAFPNNLVTGYQYFKDNRVKSIVTTNGSTELIKNEYTYNSAGETETAASTLQGVTQNRSYEYDGLGRLATEIDADSQLTLEQLQYDPFGNRRTRTADGTTFHHINNNLHQLLEIRSGSATGAVIANFTYDNNGNLTNKTYEGQSTAIGYDAMDRLVSVTGDVPEAEAYIYDHSYRRIAKSVGSATTSYHYSGPDIIAEYDSSWSSPTALYGHGAAMDDPLVRVATTTGDVRFYHADGLGSIVGVSDLQGTLTGTNRYGAWGNVTHVTGTTPQYGYTGREPDATGLLYYRLRYYDPQIGRFTQPDPKGFIDGLNRYAYVMNSPMNYVDPWGLSASTATITGNSGGYVSAITQTISSSVSLVGSAINNGIIQPTNTILKLPNQIADSTFSSLGISELDTAEERFAAAQSTPIPGDDVIFGALGAISKINSSTKSTNIVYRGLAKGENVSEGLTARAPSAGNSEISHVAGKQQTQWISTTKDLDTALNKYGEHGVIQIDLNKVNTQVSDVSNGFSNGGRMSNWAKKDQEVLIQDHIPATAIERIK